MPSEPSGSTVRAAADAVLAAVDDAYTLDLARRLVRIPSVYRPGDPRGNEAAAAAFVAEELRRLDLMVRVEAAAPGRPNVIADLPGPAGGPLLILEGHTDVVTEGEAAAWSVPPFGGEIRDGRLYGRGSADMKAGLAAAIGAVRALRDAGAPLSGTVRLAVVADEEGMMLGIKSFIRNGWAEGAQGAIICEPEENAMCLVQKGAMRALARFRGRMAHGAMPKSGCNPIPAAAALVREAEALEARYVSRHGRHALLGEPSVTPTLLRAGDPAQLNVMHADALVGLDIRTIPGQDLAAIRADLVAAADSAAAATRGCRAELEVIEERPWTETDPAAPIARAVADACRRVQGRPPRLAGVPGATDGTFLHAWAHVPIVTIGPGDVTIPHQVDEFVRVADIAEACRIYAAAACYFLRHTPAGRSS
ncbi:MAG TPA: M20 family metallopeptidase [bacterium]|nr:M20 family metallopeptidase [bacterium]